MNCPNCNARLIEIELEEVTVDYCENCEGIFYDSNELQKVLSNSAGDNDKEIAQLLKVSFTGQKSGNHEKICPKDQTLMMSVEYPKESDIKLDYCTRCRGLWTDKNETEKILKYQIKVENTGKELNKETTRLRKEENAKTVWRAEIIFDAILDLFDI